jgi:hypothetical protein
VTVDYKNLAASSCASWPNAPFLVGDVQDAANSLSILSLTRNGSIVEDIHDLSGLEAQLFAGIVAKPFSTFQSQAGRFKLLLNILDPHGPLPLDEIKTRISLL